VVNIKLPDPYLELFSGIKISAGTDLKDLIKISHYLKYKYHTQILQVFYQSTFTSISELRKFTDILDRSHINRCLDYFIHDGIIRVLSNNDPDFQLTKNFWKSHYKTSPYTPQLFIINPYWHSMLKIFDKILSRFTTKERLGDINRRFNAYTLYKETIESERSTYLKLKNDSIGKCYNCTKLIRVGSIRGKHYHKYPIGLICNRCNKTADIDKMREWRQNGRK
jgi:hypothetical protein